VIASAASFPVKAGLRLRTALSAVSSIEPSSDVPSVPRANIPPVGSGVLLEIPAGVDESRQECSPAKVDRLCFRTDMPSCIGERSGEQDRAVLHRQALDILRSLSAHREDVATGKKHVGRLGVHDASPDAREHEHDGQNAHHVLQGPSGPHVARQG